MIRDLQEALERKHHFLIQGNERKSQSQLLTMIKLL